LCTEYSRRLMNLRLRRCRHSILTMSLLSFLGRQILIT